MDFPFYKQILQEAPPSEPADLPPSRPTSEIRSETYMPDAGLVDAVNVALLLGQPLLLTGEPGTGKTHLAYHVAWQFGLPILKFETKSDHKAQDLFYIYDALRHFHAVQMAQTCNQDTPNAKDYLEYKALGRAIIWANEREKVKKFLSAADFNKHPGKPQRSVVLIDEIDKAPRDFPNDILNEVEDKHFRVPELGIDNEIVADKQFKPILILTSNSEKHLPAAFLRRCVYYNIPFPDRKVLSQIVEKRLGQTVKNSSEFLKDALDLFSDLRTQLREKPATAKLLNWLMTLHQMFKGRNRAEYHYPNDLARTLNTLVTNDDDQKMAKDIFKDWIDKKKNAKQIVE